MRRGEEEPCVRCRIQKCFTRILIRHAHTHTHTAGQGTIASGLEKQQIVLLEWGSIGCFVFSSLFPFPPTQKLHLIRYIHKRLFTPRFPISYNRAPFPEFRLHESYGAYRFGRGRESPGFKRFFTRRQLAEYFKNDIANKIETDSTAIINGDR